MRRAGWMLWAAMVGGCSGSTTPTVMDAGGDGSRLDAADDLAVDVATPTDRGSLPPYVDPFQCAAAPMVLPLDEPLDASQARAGVVRSESELIGGEGASGRVGHFKLYNQRVRFIVQGVGAATGALRPIGYDLYGGNLIDADRVRPRGEPGQDVFRETFGLFGYRVGTVDDVSVVCDGSNGSPAVVRVIGRDGPTRILGDLDRLARNRNARIITHYILRPGSELLEIRTEVQSLSFAAIGAAATGDFLGFGSALSLFTEWTGFGNASRASMPLRWIAGAADPGEGRRRVSYAIGPAMGAMSVPIVDASGTIGLYQTIDVPEAMPSVFTRYFSVGTGDVASAVEPLLRQRREMFGTVVGRTTPGALVYAYTGSYTVGAAARMMVRAADDGAFRMPLAAGSYSLIAVDAGRTRGAPVMVTVTNDAEATANPMAGATGTLVLDVAAMGEGGARVRVPMKVSLQGMGVEEPDDGLGDLEGESESYDLHRAIYAQSGIERVAVKPGRYRVIVSRGVEYDVSRSEIEVTAGGEATVMATLRHSVETPGWVSADFHQHTVGSIDSGRGLCGRVLENVAEGLEYAASTEHDNVSDFGPCITSLGLAEWFGAMQGNEVSVIGVGHFNMYPLTIDASDPTQLIGSQFWADRTTQQTFDRVRALPSDPILHVSHPRSTGLKGYFTSIALDPITLETTRGLATGWEAMEVNESVGEPAAYLASNDAMLRSQARSNAGGVPQMHDWFAFLRRGDHPCALGNSDTHTRNGGSGYPRNLVRVGIDAPRMVTPAMMREAIRGQRVVVNGGITVGVTVGGMSRMGWQEVVRPTDGAVELEVDVQAPDWVSARSVVVFENGRPLTLTATGAGRFDGAVATAAGDAFVLPLTAQSPGANGARRLRATVRVRPSRDSFYVVLARGGELSPVGPGNAFGYTNPVYVDVAGDGWRP